MAIKNKNDKIISEMLADLIDPSEETEIVEKYGKKWAMRPISSQEYLDALKESQSYKQDDLTRMFGMQISILKHALVSVNGLILTDEQKNKILNAISPAVLTTLYNEFEAIRHKSDDEIAKKENEVTEETIGNTTIDA